MTQPQRILVCGHRSFAAKGLEAHLVGRGHTVTNFSRGRVGIDGNVVTGPVLSLHENPHLRGPFDTVINYILLKDDPIERNQEYLDALLKLCASTGVKRLIHISSVSVYASSETQIREDALVETDPNKKGSYGGLKVATDLYLSQRTPKELVLTMFRPGFILGPGLINPIIGMGARLPGNQVLLVGSSKNRVCVVTRELVHEAVAATVDSPPQGNRETILATDSDGPTRREFLEECCRSLGIGTWVISFPTPLWLFAAMGGEVMVKLAGMKVKPYKLISAACRKQTFDSSVTERRLGMKFTCDWRKALSESMDAQEPNWEFPHRPAKPETRTMRRVSFIGFGGIVKQKHLPALKKIGFAGELDAYDLHGGRETEGYTIKAIEGARLRPSDLYVVASPGPVHNEAIPMLRDAAGPILVEKPLCYTDAELDEWKRLDASRPANGKVYVLQNSRFKSNVMAMMAHLEKFNAGRLLHVEVNYQSPPISADGAPWRRAERRSQTLLLDYALHFLDVAMMFTKGPWDLKDLRWELNQQGQTGMIEGRATSEAYPVSFTLRHGFIPRRARVLFTFQNYLCSLGFFPDTFVPYMSFDSWSLYRREAKLNFRSTMSKIVDKLTRRDGDESHALTMMAALGDERLAGSLALANLEHVYRLLFRIGHEVYGA